MSHHGPPPPPPPPPGITNGVQVQYVSTTNIQPAITTHMDSTPQMQQLHLTPWDLCLLPIQYIQKGLVFFMKHKEEKEEKNLHIIQHLKTTLSQVLTDFYPLAGRLGTTFNDEDNTTTVYINCNSAGAEFIHATVEITVSDLLNPVYVPSIVRSFFPHVVVTNYDGRTQPLLSVQVTELIDGIFIGFSANHSACGGTSLWNFINSWSQISRYSLEDSKYVDDQISRPPIFKPWFLNESDLPIHMDIPFINDEHDPFIETIDIYQPPQVEIRVFHFSSENIAKLKSKANSKSGLNHPISSLQALLAHVWIAVTRARQLDSNEVTNLFLLMGNKTRLNPPLPEEYFGNDVSPGRAHVKVGELFEKGLGFGASLLSKLVETHNDGSIRNSWKTWVEKPVLYTPKNKSHSNLNMGGSPKFDVYGNDFGWGRPIAVRSGCANKFEGKIESFPGIVQGSIDIEVYLPLDTLEALGGDAEFMEAVTILPPFKKHCFSKHFIRSCI